VTDIINIIRKLSSELFPSVLEVRRHLHKNPELSFQEYNTSKYISEQLIKHGIEVHEGIAGTGLVAFIHGRNPESKTIALRADMDALPIHETNEVPYKSIIPGVMHACGHDVHSACLVGAAIILNSLKDNFSGTVKFIFQPGEEKLPGGASLMIKEGVLENPRPSAIIAQHVFPSLAVGKVGFRKGMYMASTDEIYLTVKGKGGHAAMPAQYNNPIYIASEILLRLNKKFKEPFETPTVLAFGKFIAEGATNVIPEFVKIEGTFRTMNEAWRTEAHSIIQSIAEQTAAEFNASLELQILKGYPFLVNDEAVTQNAIDAATLYLGKENVEELELRMTGEDFAFYSHHIPACFYRLGTGNPSKGITSGVHTSTFDIDEKAIETGMGLMAFLTLKELEVEK
jgi:amidohydrolase